MYKNIQIYKYNQHSSGTISQQDESEILSSLNSNNFPQRFSTNGLIPSSIIEKIGQEIEQEFSWEYRDNCHTWSKKVSKALNWDIVTGYLCEDKSLGQNNLILRAHSVVRGCNKKLVELTILFPSNSYAFIEHNSGKLGIDLEATK